MTTASELRQWTLAVDTDRVAWLTFDRPGHSANALSRAAMTELDERLGEIESARPAGLVIVSGKSGFIAGQFQRHFLMLGLEGGVIGGGLAILLFGVAGIVSSWGVGTASGEQVATLFGSFALGWGGYLAIVAQIVLVAAVTALASRRTVNRTLETVE